MAKVSANGRRPRLVLSPNKPLAAQAFSDFKAFFPHNAVQYFVSYYDYYQPEAYIPQSDTYIEKDALVNDEIDRMRHSATASLFERRDVVVVASVSCIYGIGEPETYHGMHVALRAGQSMDRDTLIRSLVAVQYERNDYDFRRGTFRVRGDVVEVFPAAAESEALRVEFWGDTVERLMTLEPLRGVTTGSVPEVRIYPASHYVTPAAQLERAIEGIMDELRVRLVPQTLYVSATPGPYELEKAGVERSGVGRGLAGGTMAEQIIRPTGLMDPQITVRPASSQVDDLMAEVRARAERDERVLITTLTKRMAEDLTEYYQQNGLRVRYLHSDLDTLERLALIRRRRLGQFHGLIRINLRRY